MSDNNLITATDIAKLLDVSNAAITRAIKKGYKVRGHEVKPFAVLNEGGRLKGFRKDLYKAIRKRRENPDIDKKESLNTNEPIKGKDGDKPKAVVMEDNSIRFLDDGGAKDFGSAITKSSALMVVPKTIDSINNLEDYNKDALFGTLITICFGAFGYMAGGENKPLMAVGAGTLGLGVYTWYKNNSRNLGGDRALLGSNPSTSQMAGIEESSRSEKGLAGSHSNMRPVVKPTISAPKAVNP